MPAACAAAQMISTHDGRLMRALRYVCVPTGPQLPPPPVTSGLVAWYHGGSFEPDVGGTGVWWDASSRVEGVNDTAADDTMQVDGIGVGSDTINGLPYLYGGDASRIMFPATILPPVYTLFHVARDGPVRDTIFVPAYPSATQYYNWKSGASVIGD